MNDFPISVSRDGATGITTVELSPYLGVDRAEELGRAFEIALADERPLIVVGMENVSFLCSSAIGKLISAVGKAREKSGAVVFSDIPPKIRTVLGYLDVLDYIDYAGGRREAENKVLALAESNGAGVIKDVNAALAEAIALNKAGDTEAAARLLKRILELEPENAGALVWYADVKEKTGEVDYARELFRRASEIVTPADGLYEYLDARLKRLDGRETFDDEVTEKAVRSLGAGELPPSPYVSSERGLTARTKLFFSSFRPAYEGLGGRDDGSETYGGYFLAAAGLGLVIDPGVGFVESFSRYGGTAGDVDVLMVTRFSGSSDGDLTRVLDAAALSERDGVKVYANRTAYKYYYTLLNDYGDAVAEVALAEPGESFTVGDVTVTPIPIRFEERFGGKEALGLIIKTDKFVVGYVGEPNRLEMGDVDDWLPVRGGLFVFGLDVRSGKRPSLKDYLRFVSIVKPAAILCSGRAPLSYLQSFADTLARLAGTEVYVTCEGTAFDLERSEPVPVREL